MRLGLILDFRFCTSDIADGPSLGRPTSKAKSKQRKEFLFGEGEPFSSD